MLLVFALSITPKQILHNLFASHIDNRPVKISQAPFQLTSAGYNCDNDNLVAESNYTNDLTLYSFPVFTVFSLYLQKDISYNSVYKVYQSLRGPPENLC